MSSHLSWLACICGLTAFCGSVGADHEHESHVNAPHGIHEECGKPFTCYMKAINRPWNTAPNVSIVGSSIEVLLDRTYRNSTCIEIPKTVTHTTKTTHSVAVTGGGELTGSAEIAGEILVAKCKAVGSIKVNSSTSAGGSEEVTESSETSFKLRPCMSIRFIIQERKVQVKGDIESWDCEYACQCECDANVPGSSHKGFCNRVKLVASGTGWTQWVEDIVPGPPVKSCPACDGQGDGAVLTPSPDPNLPPFPFDGGSTGNL